MKEVISGDSDPANHLIVETRGLAGRMAWASTSHLKPPATKGPGRVIKKQMGGVNSPMNGRVGSQDVEICHHAGLELGKVGLLKTREPYLQKWPS